MLKGEFDKLKESKGGQRIQGSSSFKNRLSYLWLYFYFGAKKPMRITERGFETRASKGLKTTRAPQTKHPRPSDKNAPFRLKQTNQQASDSGRKFEN
jgi:hypothetical protein